MPGRGSFVADGYRYRPVAEDVPLGLESGDVPGRTEFRRPCLGVGTQGGFKPYDIRSGDGSGAGHVRGCGQDLPGRSCGPGQGDHPDRASFHGRGLTIVTGQEGFWSVTGRVMA